MWKDGLTNDSLSDLHFALLMKLTFWSKVNSFSVQPDRLAGPHNLLDHLHTLLHVHDDPWDLEGPVLYALPTLGHRVGGRRSHLPAHHPRGPLVLVRVLGNHPHNNHVDPLLERLLVEGGGVVPRTVDGLPRAVHGVGAVTLYRRGGARARTRVTRAVASVVRLIKCWILAYNFKLKRIYLCQLSNLLCFIRGNAYKITKRMLTNAVHTTEVMLIMPETAFLKNCLNKLLTEKTLALRKFTLVFWFDMTGMNPRCGTRVMLLFCTWKMWE